MAENLNVWEFGDCLGLAARLRKRNQCPPDIDALYGAIMEGVVRMATAIFVRDDRYRHYAEEFMGHDIQVEMLYHALVAMEDSADTMRTPRQIVNYLVKTVQNRLRNIIRDRGRLKRSATVVTESELGFDIGECGNVVRGYDGSLVRNYRSGKVETREFDN